MISFWVEMKQNVKNFYKGLSFNQTLVKKFVQFCFGPYKILENNWKLNKYESK